MTEQTKLTDAHAELVRDFLRRDLSFVNGEERLDGVEEGAEIGIISIELKEVEAFFEVEGKRLLVGLTALGLAVSPALPETVLQARQHSATKGNPLPLQEPRNA